MDSTSASLELLAHFDSLDLDESSRPPIGVIDVLKWAVALSVIFFAGCVLLQLGYCMAAERVLSHAARAGALEATLPRATRESVVQSIERRLPDISYAASDLQIAIRHNDAPIQRVFRLADDDRVSVTISLPVDAALPTWLRKVGFWRDAPRVEASAERRVPGRQLAMTGRD
jgi:hypothetical protein